MYTILTNVLPKALYGPSPITVSFTEVHEVYTDLFSNINVDSRVDYTVCIYFDFSRIKI